MKYSNEKYNRLMNTLNIIGKYAHEMNMELSKYDDIVKHYLSDKQITCRLDIIATEKIIEQKKKMMKDNIDIYYDICKILRYPNIKSYDDFNPEFNEGNDLPKNFDIALLESYDRLLMRAMLEALPKNNRVSVSLDISVTERELEIKKELIKFGSEHYFDTLHTQGIPTILS